MGFYDRFKVGENNINLPPSETYYESKDLGCTLAEVTISADGVLSYTEEGSGGLNCLQSKDDPDLKKIQEGTFCSKDLQLVGKLADNEFGFFYLTVSNNQVTRVEDENSLLLWVKEEPAFPVLESKNQGSSVRINFGNEVLQNLKVFLIPSLNTIVYIETDSYLPTSPAGWERLADWVNTGEYSERFYIEGRYPYYHDEGQVGQTFYKIFGHEQQLEAILNLLPKSTDEREENAVLAVFPGKASLVLNQPVKQETSNNEHP